MCVRVCVFGPWFVLTLVDWRDETWKKSLYTTTRTGHIASHSDEDDPERLRFLLAKGEEHRLWILQKYNKSDPYAGRNNSGSR